jgi:uncharacterized membrane protein
MERMRGAAAGLVFGLLISPIVGIATFLLMFSVSILSLTRIAFFEQLQRATTVVGDGHPVAWGIFAMGLTCLVSIVIGYVRAWRFFSATSIS